MNKDCDNTALELIIGNIVYGTVGVLIILIFPSRVYNIIGFVWGVIVSCIMTWHMYISLKKSLDMSESQALKSVRFKYIFRVFIVLILFAILEKLGCGSVILGVVGLFALKVSAYLQPFTHKFLERKFTEKGR